MCARLALLCRASVVSLFHGAGERGAQCGRAELRCGSVGGGASDTHVPLVFDERVGIYLAVICAPARQYDENDKNYMLYTARLSRIVNRLYIASRSHRRAPARPSGRSLLSIDSTNQTNKCSPRLQHVYHDNVAAHLESRDSHVPVYCLDMAELCSKA